MTKKLYTATFTLDGKRHYVRSSKSQREAEQRAARKRAELESGRHVLSPNTRFEEYAAQYLSVYVQPQISHPEFVRCQMYLREHINPQLGRLRLGDIRPIQVQRIFNTAPARGRDWYLKLFSLLRRIFRQAMCDGLVLRDPTQSVRLPKAAHGTHRSLTEAERACLLFAADWHSFGLFLQVCLWCGLRPQETAALRVEDIDPTGQRLRVCRAFKADKTLGQPKSASGNRVVPIPPQLWVRLKPRLPEQGYLFRNTVGADMHNARFRAWEAFKQFMSELSGQPVAPDLTMYCLRHTYGTDLQAAGVPINVAKDLMGHSDIAMTARVYTHMREDILQDAADKIAIFGATQGATAARASAGVCGGRAPKNQTRKK